MSLRRSFVSILSRLFALVLLATVLFPMPAEAASTTIMAAKTVTVQPGKSFSYTFKSTKKQVFNTQIHTKLSEYCTKGGIRIILKTSKGKTIQNDFESYVDCKAGFEYDEWHYSDGFFQPKGTYTYTIKNTSDTPIRMKILIKGYTQIANTFTFSKKINAKYDTWTKVGTIKDAGSKLPCVKDVKANKTGVIDGYYWDAKGNLYIASLKPGTYTVTVTMNSGKKYSSKVKVLPPDPNFQAEIDGYYTRDNYFLVRFVNKGTGTLQIFSNGAKACNFDYKVYDRSLKLNRSCYDIMPGKTVTLKFYVKGSTTWPNAKDFWIDYTFSYYNNKYSGRLFYEPTDSEYKKTSKGWYTTYWNNTKYWNNVL